MSELSGVHDLDDIWYDLEGPRRSSPPPPSYTARVRRTRGLGPVDAPAGPAASPLRPGLELLRGCGEWAPRRFQTLLHLERHFHPEGDFGYLISPACQIFESEFDRQLATPARGVAGDLIDALHQADPKSKQSAILEKWDANQVPTTIGVISLILLALRRGVEQGRAPVLEFLDTAYTPGFARLLATKALGRSFDAIREMYRNPASHGTRVFSADDYAAFAHLMVARARFAVWAEVGPEPPGPGPEAGVFHHQIATSRLVAPAPALATAAPPSAAERFLGHVASAASGAVAIVARHADDPASPKRPTRDLSAGVGGTPTFRIDDSVRFEVEASVAGHLTLLDFGTSGAVVVALPNAQRREVLLEPGRPVTFPDRARPECALVLSGPPGVERILALVTREPLPFPLAPEDDASLFRPLRAPDLAQLAAFLDRLDPASWASARCDLTVQARFDRF